MDKADLVKAIALGHEQSLIFRKRNYEIRALLKEHGPRMSGGEIERLRDEYDCNDVMVEEFRKLIVRASSALPFEPVSIGSVSGV